MRSSTPGWRPVLVVAGCALLALIAIDATLHLVAQPHRQTEVHDAMGRLERGAPRVIALGSSHARTFDVLDTLLGDAGEPSGTVAAIPMEWGKLASYEWVLRHRILPALDRKPATAQPEEFILITEWWDSTPPEDGQAWNLPARAWTWRHFLADVAAHGITSFNNNYLQRKWSEAWRSSILVSDRGHREIARGLRRRVSPDDPAAVATERQRQLLGWQRMIEAGSQDMLDAEQMAALDRILDLLESRGLRTTVLLYPRMPGTISERGRAVTLDVFSAEMARIASQRGLGLLDLTAPDFLADEHFEADFDHLTPQAHRLLALRILEEGLPHLGELLQPRGAAR